MAPSEPATAYALPGEDLVTSGIADLAAGRETVEAMLVACAATRLRALGYAVAPSVPADAGARLYALVEAEVGPGRAHGRYNALRQRMSSFLRSASAPSA